MSTLAPARITSRMQWLEYMLLIRHFEEAGERLSLRGKIPAGIHPSIGQEAVAVGTMAALEPGDVICGTHRSHHLALARGLDPSLLMAELYGKGQSLLGGRGGSMHLADFDVGFWGSNGIVGAGVAMAMGAALGMRMAGDAHVAVGFVGDGGMNIGRLWESINLAVVWSLPLLVIVENNLYAVETPSNAVTGGGSIINRARGFGIAATRVDGQDMDVMRDAVAEARLRAVSGQGPSFIEAETYRFSGHGSGEKANYRTKEEIEAWRRTRDPITVLANRLIDSGDLTESGMDTAVKIAGERVEAAVAFAEAAQGPDTSVSDKGVDGWSLEVRRNE